MGTLDTLAAGQLRYYRNEPARLIQLNNRMKGRDGEEWACGTPQGGSEFLPTSFLERGTRPLVWQSGVTVEQPTQGAFQLVTELDVTVNVADGVYHRGARNAGAEAKWPIGFYHDWEERGAVTGRDYFKQQV